MRNNTDGLLITESQKNQEKISAGYEDMQYFTYFGKM